VQVDTCKVSIGLEPDVSPEANDKPDVNPVAASTHSKLAGDLHLCSQARMSDAHHSLAAHPQTVMPCWHAPCVNIFHVRIADSAGSACLVGTFYVTISHVKKLLKVLAVS
jgi:hypothetical protein